MPEIEKKEVSSIGIVGFCWGAVPTVLGVNESQKFKCAISYHPSLALLKFFDMDWVEYTKKVDVPLMLFPTD